MGLFGTQKASTGTIEDVAHMVERYFKERSMSPKVQEVAGSEGSGWWLTEGSARIYIFLQDAPGGSILRVTSPIVTLPTINREAFFRHLLNLNSNLTSCKLALHEDIVMVVAQRHTLQLQQEELNDLVWNVAYVADLLDDKLIAEFGAARYIS
jgi:hypothetical protein